MKLYYIILIILCTAFSIVFCDHINITMASLLPLFLMMLSVFQSVYFHNHREKKDFNINNDSPLTEKEWEKVAVYMRNSYMIVTPLFVPFVMFFTSWAKAISIILYLIGFVGGMLYYRLRYHKEIKRRVSDEMTELKEQKKKEELGKWK
ncbi:MAG: hypothetical protein E7583_11670 [Ruminococcaceae bacterium]|nr:hypothetical protein [Oscillospiraceae bacterium]MBE6708140.1 hypothetical protein [Oscillospiraceae bacterium]